MQDIRRTGTSAIGVLDKTQAILMTLASGPQKLADVVAATQIPRPTCHRILTALLVHEMVQVDGSHTFSLGPAIDRLARARSAEFLSGIAQPYLDQLRTETSESAQLYRRVGDRRRCIAVSEVDFGLRDTVPLGVELPMSAGSAAQVFRAYEDNPEIAGAEFDGDVLEQVRGNGWAWTEGERQPGVASVSAPIWNDQLVLAVVSVSGPTSRISQVRVPALAASVRRAADQIGQAVASRGL